MEILTCGYFEQVDGREYIFGLKLGYCTRPLNTECPSKVCFQNQNCILKKILFGVRYHLIKKYGIESEEQINMILYL